LKIAESACVGDHADHEGDYIAVDDPTCGGGGCLPEAAPCDGSLPCCEGLQCTDGTCAVACPCDAAYADAIEQWGDLSGDLVEFTPNSIQCRHYLESGDHLLLASEAFGPPGTGCFAWAFVGGVALADTFIVASFEERVACGETLKAICTR
jgi:hypothetical protein